MRSLRTYAAVVFAALAMGLIAVSSASATVTFDGTVSLDRDETVPGLGPLGPCDFSMDATHEPLSATTLAATTFAGRGTAQSCDDLDLQVTADIGATFSSSTAGSFGPTIEVEDMASGCTYTTSGAISVTNDAVSGDDGVWSGTRSATSGDFPCNLVAGTITISGTFIAEEDPPPTEDPPPVAFDGTFSGSTWQGEIGPCDFRIEAAGGPPAATTLTATTFAGRGDGDDDPCDESAVTVLNDASVTFSGGDEGTLASGLQVEDNDSGCTYTVNAAVDLTSDTTAGDDGVWSGTGGATSGDFPCIFAPLTFSVSGTFTTGDDPTTDDPPTDDDPEPAGFDGTVSGSTWMGEIAPCDFSIDTTAGPPAATTLTGATFVGRTDGENDPCDESVYSVETNPSVTFSSSTAGSLASGVRVHDNNTGCTYTTSSAIALTNDATAGADGVWSGTGSATSGDFPCNFAPLTFTVSGTFTTP